jgi:energy-coupling factor transporter ATP-binding protein EcfA2
MLKKITLIQGVGNYRKAAMGGVNFNKPVIVVYGENRNGKSTLCDVLHSLESGESSLILNRNSIPEKPEQLAKVEILFEKKDGSSFVSKFENEKWQLNRIPDCSKLYVFDHGFIHRNVITGQRPERQNSENVTSFILGETNTALFKQLANMNEQLRQERASLTSSITAQLTSREIENPEEYANSPLPSESKEVILAEADGFKQKEEQIKKTIQNAKNIKNRRILSFIGKKANYNQITESINSILTSGFQNVHQASMAILEIHMKTHVYKEDVFKGWASQGIGLIKDESCPFCGQEFQESAKDLISIYQQAFNAEFDAFNKNTKQKINQLRLLFTLPNTRENLDNQHQINRDVFEIYQEPEILNEPHSIELRASLEQCFQEVSNSFNELSANIETVISSLTPYLDQKYLTPYESIQQIDFTELSQAEIKYNQAIHDYWQVAEKINTVLEQFKQSIKSPKLREEMEELQRKYTEKMHLVKRKELEPICSQYRQKKSEITTLQSQYDSQNQLLEQSQSEYLQNYFDLINTLFSDLGTRDFTIDKTINRRGIQIVYALAVKFKNQEIPADKIHCVFSESDKRALALCIFLAKIVSLTEDEKAKAIIVMDDPVTSFDNERISLILIKLDELHRGGIKQLIITTHYKGMAAQTIKKFNKKFSGNPIVGAVKLIHDANGFTIIDVKNDDMIASAHDIAFDKIQAFVNREINKDIDMIRDLRPFLEEEIKHRFKKQLKGLGIIKSDMADWITALENNGHISTVLANKLQAIRNTFNTPMHELGDEYIENTRALAHKILNIVYDELTPKHDGVVKNKQQ